MNSKLVSALRPWLVLALVCGGFSLHPDFLHAFWTRDYLPTIAQQAATNVILAVGLTFVILTGGIDLSVGSVLALCGVALGLSLKGDVPPFLTALMALPVGVLVAFLVMRLAAQRAADDKKFLALGGAFGIATTLGVGYLLARGMANGSTLLVGISAALLVGLACGFINGAVVAWAKVPSFVVTLGMLTAARGLTVYATDGQSVGELPPQLSWFGQGAPLILIALIVIICGALLQMKTVAGRYIQALGSNEQAARFSGVNVEGYKAFAYVLSGLTAAIAAIVLTAKFGVADTGAGAGAELNAIAAVVIGGTSLSGGRGSVIGSLVGALTIAVLNSGLVLMRVPGTLQEVVIGVVIVVIVVVDQLQKGRTS
jgi:ribose/xylose/arabinose/galactoside ABC-type transport system permease subunit